MKKVLFVATVFRFLNFEKSDMKLLQDLGFEVHTATNMHGEKWLQDDGSFESLGLINHQIDFDRTPFSIKSAKSYKQLKKLMDTHHFDIIHCHTPVAAAIARIAALGTRKKGSYIIYTCHGFHFNKSSSKKSWLLYYPIEKILAKATDMIITINKEDYGVIQKFNVPEKRYIHGVGVDVDHIISLKPDIAGVRKKLNIPANAFVILTIGELSDRKNQMVILKALAKLQNDKLFYIMCGTGSKYDEYKKYVTDNGLNKQVLFTGQLSHEQVFNISKCVDIGAIPSKIEGLGLAGIEILAAGKPLIGSNVHGIKDYLIDNLTGISFNPEDVDAASDAIMRFYVDKKYYSLCSSNAMVVAQKFDINVSRLEMLQIYKEVSLEVEDDE
mgnify:CR=1 FL=1|jgi:glycosyltransferase involved in cell wall biosynthesis